MAYYVWRKKNFTVSIENSIYKKKKHNLRSKKILRKTISLLGRLHKINFLKSTT